MRSQAVRLYNAVHTICSYYRRLQTYYHIPGRMWYIESCTISPTVRVYFYCVLKARNPWIPVVRIPDTYMHYSHSPTAMRIYRIVTEWKYLSENLISNVKPDSN